MKRFTPIVIIALIAGLSLNAQASGTRTVPADAFKSSDGTHTNTLPAITGTIVNTNTLVSSTPASVSISGTTVDWSTAFVFYKTLSANTTLTFSNVTDGQTIVVDLLNTASNYTVTWPSTSGSFTVYWPGGTAPTQTTGAHADTCTFIALRGNAIRASCVQNF